MWLEGGYEEEGGRNGDKDLIEHVVIEEIVVF